jgi:hypothetical protein
LRSMKGLGTAASARLRSKPEFAHFPKCRVCKRVLKFA